MKLIGITDKVYKNMSFSAITSRTVKIRDYTLEQININGKTSWFILCSGVSYFLMMPLASNKCMLLVLIVVVSLNFFTRPSASATAMFSPDRVSSKCTFVSVLCSRKSWISKHHNISLARKSGIP